MDSMQRSSAAYRGQGPEPLVSVVVPTYNRAHVLPRALDSALGQTFGDFEVLVIDDGSSDDTEAVVQGLDDERIRYIRQPANRGVSAARNRGIREARGAYIAFLDSDDEWLPEKLERQVALLGRAPAAVGMIYTGAENLHVGGKRTVYRPREQGSIEMALYRHNVVHATPSVMLRRAVVESVGLFDETLPAIEDYDYWVRVARRWHVRVIPDPLVVCHDVELDGRKSRDIDANLEARKAFFNRHADGLKRAKMAHRFLFESARRQLHRGCWRPGPARRLLTRGLAIRPWSKEGWALLLRSFVPRAIFVTMASRLNRSGER